jgi:hypothetical protein
LRQGSLCQLSLSGSSGSFRFTLGAFVSVILLVPLSSQSLCRRWHIQGITPGLRFFGNPSLKCMRPGRLLSVSTVNESILESYPVPIIRFTLR